MKTSIGPLKNKEGSLTDNDKEMANLLKEQFTSAFSPPDSNIEEISFDMEDENPLTLNNMHISEARIMMQ